MIYRKEALVLYPAKPQIKDITKGSGFGKIVIMNDTLRTQPK